MTSAIQGELHSFATQLLEQTGGAVDWPSPDEDGVAIVPAEVARLLYARDETLRLSSRPGGDGLAVSLATEFLDASATLLEARVPRIGCFRSGGRYLKGGDLQDAVDRAYDWLNARVRVRARREVSVEYHTWWFFASLRSEDVWETRLSATLNAATNVEVLLPDPLEAVDLEPQPLAAIDEAASRASYDAAVGVARERIKRLAGEFLRRMESRLDRDRRRLREYYGALKREAGRKRPRTSEPPSREEAEARNRAVDLELRRKLAEVEERYAIEAVLRPIALIRSEVPALAVDLDVQRKRAQRVYTVYWNSLLKEFEPLRCSRCGEGALAVAFTNDDVEALCLRCHNATGGPAEVARGPVRKAK